MATSDIGRYANMYVTTGPAQLACNEGSNVQYPATAPGFRHDPTNYTNTQPSLQVCSSSLMFAHCPPPLPQGVGINLSTEACTYINNTGIVARTIARHLTSSGAAKKSKVLDFCNTRRPERLAFLSVGTLLKQKRGTAKSPASGVAHCAGQSIRSQKFLFYLSVSDYLCNTLQTSARSYLHTLSLAAWQWAGRMSHPNRWPLAMTWLFGAADCFDTNLHRAQVQVPFEL